jgi:hypothetical protein
MNRVDELIPGDRIQVLGRTSTYVGRLSHPIWKHLQLVIWRMDDGTWSHDALDIRQEVGSIQPTTPEQRMQCLKQALLRV